MYTITRSETSDKRTRKLEKYRYEITAMNSHEKFIALYWEGLKYPIVFNFQHQDTVGHYNWYIGNNYAYAAVGNDQCSMHIIIMQETDEYKNKPENTNIDHINEFKLDNRMENLRIATNSEQNTNRKTRADKQAPAQELIDAGVTELPKYVRWDKKEKKFVIEKHPVLIRLCVDKKPLLSGSKSSKLSVIEKYQDILYKLQELDKQLPESDSDFKDKKARLRREYIEITNLIRSVHNEELIQEQPTVHCPVQAELKTVKGRKKISALPPDCGVSIHDLPKYCYYRPANEKRGDCFLIERHPVFVEKRSWQTSSSRALTTKEKFDEMMKVYTTLQNKLSQEL